MKWVSLSRIVLNISGLSLAVLLHITLFFVLDLGYVDFHEKHQFHEFSHSLQGKVCIVSCSWSRKLKCIFHTVTQIS